MREVRTGLAIVGGGPAALAAACTAAERGDQVLVIDRQSRPGGQIWRGKSNEWLSRFARSGAAWLGQAEVFDAAPGFRLMAQTPEGPSRSSRRASACRCGRSRAIPSLPRLDAARRLWCRRASGLDEVRTPSQRNARDRGRFRSPARCRRRGIARRRRPRTASRRTSSSGTN